MHNTGKLRNQEQAVKRRGDNAGGNQTPGDKAIPAQQVRPAEQQMDTRREAVPGAAWVGSRHPDQQQANQQRQPVRLVYIEEAPDRRAALKRELQIKRMSRAEKLKLIGQV